jgi:hypothetical protein
MPRTTLLLGLASSSLLFLACNGDNSNPCGDQACPGDGGPPIDSGADVQSSDASDASDSGPTPGAGRLFVSINKPAADGGVDGSILVWDGVNTLTTAAPPSFALAGATGGTAGLIVVGSTLVSSPQAGGFGLYPNAATLTASTPRVGWGTGYSTHDSFVYTASIDALWPTTLLSATSRFDQASTLSSSSTSAMVFSYGGYSSTFVYDEADDRAFLAQSYKPQILAWNGAKSLTGMWPGVNPSFTLSTTFVAGDMGVAHDRLYAIGNTGGPEVVGVWNNLSTITGTTAPTFTITAGNSGTSGCLATPNDLLIVCQPSGVGIWKNASTLTADVGSDFSLTTNVVMARKVVLAPTTDRLYILDNYSVTIWSSASTNPTFVAKLTTPTQAQDIAVLE